jgi:radical SAM superfamily enzyme YgiQ (UPF0313 family)
MKKALLISPPVYDTQYWERWSMPHGLLKVGTYLKRNGYQTKLIDCLEPDDKGVVKKKRVSLVQVGTGKRTKPDKWGRLAPDMKLFYCFGKDKEELEHSLRNGYLEDGDLYTPDEVWITSIMSYWWESTRDMVELCKRLFPKAKIRVGGIYPTLDPQHAAKRLGLDDPLIVPGKQLNLVDDAMMARDLIVTGEIPDANDLELDHELYFEHGHNPKYTILTTSRGCPRDCEYCAAYVLSGRKVVSREPKSVIEEIRAKYERGVRDFCFYEDNLLMSKKSFKEILTLICENKRDLKGIELHSPEGLEIRLVEPDLAKLMWDAGFRRVYLPLESINHKYISEFQRDFYTLKHFEQAVKIFEQAGFTKPQQINVFVLFGLPGEDLQHVYDTAVYAANRTGSVIPMLFAPVPGTPLFKKLEWYIEERGFDFEHLNGKLLPFLEFNRRSLRGKYDLTIQNYYDIEAFMFRLNEKVRNSTFRPGNDTRVSTAFRKVFTSYDSVYEEKERPLYFPDMPAAPAVGDSITEYHGSGKSLQVLQEDSAQLL